MTTWGVEPTVTIAVEVAFNTTDPLDAAPTWTAVTADVRGWSSSRGSSSVNVDSFSPGYVEIVLGSRTRKYDPSYAAGPYYGKLLPMKRVRITITFAAVTTTVFVGWVTAWQQDWGRHDAVAVVSAVDGTQFAEATLSSSAYAREVLADSPIRYWPLQDDYIDEVAGQELPYYVTSGRVAGAIAEGSYPIGESSALFGDSTADGYYQTTTGTWTTMRGLEAWVYIPALTAVATNDTNVIAYGGTGSIGFDFDAISGVWQLYYDNAADNVRLDAATDTTKNGFAVGWHHVALVATATTLTFMVDGTTAFSQVFSLVSAAPSAVTYVSTNVALSGAVSHIALYSTAPSTSRVQVHYNVGRYGCTGAHGDYGFEYGGARITRALDDGGFSSTLRDLDAGCTRQGPYLPAERGMMQYIGQVAQSEQGLVFFTVDGKLRFVSRQTLWTQTSQATFSDDGAGGSVLYREGSPIGKGLDTVRNVVTATWTQGAITRRDTASIAAYREKPELVDGMQADAADASNLSAYRLREDATPRDVYPQLVVPMRRNKSTTIPAVLGLELGDVVTVERTPMTLGAQTASRQIVIGIDHDFSRTEWTTTLSLLPAPTAASSAPYLTLGNATTGKVGAAFLNVVPF